MSEEHSPFDASHTDEEFEREHQRNVQQANAVWFSGFLSGESYVAAPKREMEDNRFDDVHLTQTNYMVPRGYKYNPMNLPEVLMDIPTGFLRTSVLVYVITMAVSLVLLIVSVCPVPWFKGKDITLDGVNMKDYKWTLWKITNGSVETKISDLNDCTMQQQYFQCIAASLLIALCFAFFSVIAGVLKLVKGKSSYGMMLLLGFLTFAWAICGSAMGATLYHQPNCNMGRLANVAGLHAGFALSVVAWVLLLCGTLLLAVATHLNVGPAIKGVRTYDTVFFLLLVVALLFSGVAIVGTMFERKFDTNVVKVAKVTYWHTELLQPSGSPIFFSRERYRCFDFNKRVKVSVAFLMLAILLLFLAAAVSIGAFFKSSFRLFSCILAVLAAVCLLVNWIIAIVILKSHYCSYPVTGSPLADYPGLPSGISGGNLQFTGYHLSEGVILPIVAWVITLLAVVGNAMIPWPKPKKFTSK